MSHGQDGEMVDVTPSSKRPDIQTEEDEEPVQSVFRILPGSTETAASFEFTNEDHTLGNALRHIIMKNPDVEFCGYSIPHPAEAKMHLRIQTYDKINVRDVLEKGLDDLSELCDVVIEKFTAARDKYHAEKDTG